MGRHRKGRNVHRRRDHKRPSAQGVMARGIMARGVMAQGVAKRGCGPPSVQIQLRPPAPSGPALRLVGGKDGPLLKRANRFARTAPATCRAGSIRRQAAPGAGRGDRQRPHAASLSTSWDMYLR
jgi:hypothetical protein